MRSKSTAHHDLGLAEHVRLFRFCDSLGLVAVTALRDVSVGIWDIVLLNSSFIYSSEPQPGSACSQATKSTILNVAMGHVRMSDSDTGHHCMPAGIVFN